MENSVTARFYYGYYLYLFSKDNNTPRVGLCKGERVRKADRFPLRIWTRGDDVSTMKPCSRDRPRCLNVNNPSASPPQIRDLGFGLCFSVALFLSPPTIQPMGFPKEYQFLSELGLGPRNPGCYANGAWRGGGPVVGSYNPANNQVRFLLRSLLCLGLRRPSLCVVRDPCPLVARMC